MANAISSSVVLHCSAFPSISFVKSFLLIGIFLSDMTVKKIRIYHPAKIKIVPDFYVD